MSLDLPKKIEIIEVGPRDGLQNEARVLKTDDKIEFINRLIAFLRLFLENRLRILPLSQPLGCTGTYLLNINL